MKLLFLLVFLATSWAKAVLPKSSRLAAHDGYVLDLSEEKDKEYVEIILPLGPLPQLPYKTWFQRIFDDDELQREFNDRYQRQFGRTEAEQAQSVSNPFVYIDIVDPNGSVFRGTAIDAQNQRQLFAEYMVRRMFEHNVDKFVKNDPNIRTVYEIKERISKAQVEVASGYSLAVNYSFSGNTLQIRPINPYFIFEVLYQMNPQQFGPGDVLETYWRVGKEISAKYQINSYYRQTDGILSFVFRQQFNPKFVGTLTLSTYTREQGPSVREHLGLAGLYWYY